MTAFADINGLKMYYEIHGSGHPLVLIHGGGSTIGTTFGRVINRFAEKHRVIAVELQAHGHTADIDRQMTFEQDADDVAALLVHLETGPADIFGFSNGGTTALQIAIRHPHLMSKLVVASALFKRAGAFTGFWEFMKQASLSDMPAQLKEAYLSINPDQDALRIMHDRDLYRMQHFRDIGEELIKSINAPTLIINADKDVATAEHAVEMFNLIPNARLMIVPGRHGEYIGEITTLKNNEDHHFPAVDFIEQFLLADHRQLP